MGGLAPQYFWVDCLPMGGDGQTVLNFAETGTTKFLVGLFRGVNSYFGGLAPQYFWVDCLPMGGDGQTDCFNFGGNWHYKIFGRIILRSKLIFLGEWHHNFFGWIVFRWVVMVRLFQFWRELALQIFRADCFEE